MDFVKATVTGAAGYLGNVLVRELIAQGKTVRAMVLEGEDIRSLQGLPVEIVKGDVRDLGSLASAFQGADVVFHVASMVAIDAGMWDKLEKINVQGTRNVLEACRITGVKRLVYTSSAGALTEPDPGGVLDERAGFNVWRAYGDYGKTKAAASLAVLDAVTGGLDAVLVCPAGLIGPYDFNRSDISFLFISYMRGQLPAMIRGRYDFVDVRDVAQGHILACERGKAGHTYIVSGERVETPHLVKILDALTGKNKRVPVIPTAFAHLALLFIPLYARLTRQKPPFTKFTLHTITCPFSISDRKAREELGYSSRSVEESFRDALDWYRNAGYLDVAKA